MPALVYFLIGFPLLASAALLLVAAGKLRNVLVTAACVVVAAASLAAAASSGGEPVFFGLPGGFEPGHLLLLLEVALTAFVGVVGIRSHRPLAPLLALAQLVLSAWVELAGGGGHVAADRLFCVDRLSLVMVLVIGVVGTLICVQALGYMRDYHRHYPLIHGRRTSFFFLLFVFLSAMFGLVTANALPLLFVFWEITTLCSFLLIGYARTAEVLPKAFHALELNMVGGLGFALGIALLSRQPDGLDLAALTRGPAAPALVTALAGLALAGLTKSAQLPFSSWLLGAMYAPTPTSALLHSSTMVKAGVFLLLRLSPALAGTLVANGVAMIGFGTFLATALVATTEQNAKKVLAYSTLSNLGLVVGCAGLGTPAALWVGVLLVVFHAVAKSLLFLVVGSLESRLYTKDLENFDNLVCRFPRLSLLALTGIAGMFIAPFGVLVAKWSAIRALLEVPGWQGAVFLVGLAFGSGCTLFYWTKLLLKVLAVRQIPEAERAIEARVSAWEWVAEITHAVLVVGLTAGVGALSAWVVAPLARDAFGGAGGALLHVDPLLVLVLLGAVLALPGLAWWIGRQGAFDMADVYVGGRTVTRGHLATAARGGARAVTLRNYYLDGILDGPAIFQVATAASAVVLAAVAILGMVTP